jgi:hypothetical protein
MLLHGKVLKAAGVSTLPSLLFCFTAALAALLQNKAAAASDNPETAANALSVYDYNQQQVSGACV